MKQRLLIVEDETDLLEMLCLRANYRGYKCFTDATGAHCLEKIIRLKPHLIIMDLDLPKLNGIELIIQIKSRNELANIPIIVFSSFLEPDLVKEAINLGASTYFVKTGDIDDLLDIVNAYLKDENPAHPKEFIQPVIKQFNGTKYL